MDREDTAAGLARLEGYLMSQAARHEAAAAGETFARHLSWLGPQEKDEIARRFADHHLALRRQMLHAVIERTHELRTEYSHRYAVLRRRATVTALAVVVLTAAALTLVPPLH
ncbi:hypothetical protein [Streptomyces sp. WAC06614]|uniref:hypothetical protein n=1 Tax=Streptomyces sp. WAC06614 TaxID=2487416 RepID=UPI000F7AEBB9|nr:hypothetical protein [Streptomyces sp. WAC06614]RSS81492.1 hypothetical protein EF918_10165 [Streptomyces sp. WAC06614]